MNKINGIFDDNKLFIFRDIIGWYIIIYAYIIINKKQWNFIKLIKIIPETKKVVYKELLNII